MGGKVRVGVCIEARAPRMALLEALCESEMFDVVAVAPRAEFFVPLCVPLYPDIIIMDEGAASMGPSVLAQQIAQGRRIIAAVISSGRREWDPKEVATIPNQLLKSKDARSRADLQTALFAAATPIMTSKRTYLAGELAQHADSLRQLASEASVRQEIAAIGQWPLDAILLVDDGSNVPRLGSYIGQLESLRVPVILAVESDATGCYAALKSAAPGVTRMLTATNVRRLEGFSVAPSNQQVQLSGEDIYVGPGEFSVQHLLASIGWLRSGCLSILMSTSDLQNATALASVAAAGGLVAVLDPAHCEHPHAARECLEWPAPPLMLSPDELRWVLHFALARKG